MRLAFWQQRPWLTVAVVFFVAAIVGFVIAFPAMFAATCPQCFGFKRLERGVYVQRGMAPEVQANAAQIVKQARERVRGFYGAQRAKATILICATDPCYRRLRGGTSRGMAIYDRVLMLSPLGISETIAAHELSHIEFHRRVGAWKIFRDAVPVWFDEGLAAVVSDDPRYLAPRGTADRCLVHPTQPLPETLREWLQAGGDDRLYAAAACKVSVWLAANGGPSATVNLAKRMAGGASFDDVFR